MTLSKDSRCCQVCVVVIYYDFYGASEGSFVDTEKHAFAYRPFSFQVLPLGVTTPRDSYAWKYRELGTLLTVSLKWIRTIDNYMNGQEPYRSAILTSNHE